MNILTRLSDLGDTGFTANTESSQFFVQWQNIGTMTAYKVDLITSDEMCLQITLKNGTELIANESSEGWVDFCQYIKKVFPKISPSWDIDLMFPAFASNRTTIYYASLETLVRQYFAAIEREAEQQEIMQFFHPDVEQHEFPNRLVPAGAHRTLQDLLDSGEKGKKVIANQRYEILNVIESGNRISLEVTWTGKLKIPLGTLKEGDTMTAHFGVFIEYKDGKIIKQHNYDCFEAF